MAEAPSRSGGFLLNIGLALAGVLALVLLYALATRAFTPSASPVREANPAGLVGDIIQVRVDNGCGEPGIASVATAHLREHHYDVVEVGNYTDFDQAHSLVLDRVGNREAALGVAAVLGIDEAYVREAIGDGYFVDVSVVLGRDYLALRPFQTRADDGASR